MIKLMNTGLACPEEFFIFCAEDKPDTVHNLTFTKTFTSAAFTGCSMNRDFLNKYLDGSASYLPFLPAKTDCNVLSPYCVTAINNYRVEYDAEICRKAYFPKYPSRLSAIFAFGDKETCHKVVDKYGEEWRDIKTVKKFRLIETPLTRVVKVNMEIISLARDAYRISYSDQNVLDTIWRQYWSGGGNMRLELPNANFRRGVKESGEIYEYLIEGVMELVDTC